MGQRSSSFSSQKPWVTYSCDSLAVLIRWLLLCEATYWVLQYARQSFISQGSICISITISQGRVECSEISNCLGTVTLLVDVGQELDTSFFGPKGQHFLLIHSSLSSLLPLPLPPMPLPAGGTVTTEVRAWEVEWNQMSAIGNVCRSQLLLFLLVSPTPASETALGTHFGVSSLLHVQAS